MRASARTRERTLERLRDGYAGGELHTETFDHRVDCALRAATSTELYGLTVDLPAGGGWWRRAVAALRDVPWRASGEPAPSLLAAAGLRGGRLTLGRAPSCELVFADDTVSRRHAALRLEPDGRWRLCDLGSLNGTWVNGRRVYDAEVVPGDEVALGEATFRL